MLTEKQEKFCTNILSGMNQTDAYKNAYSVENMSDEAIYVEASRLVDNPKVSLRIKELRDKASNEAIISSIERKKWLTSVINGEDKLDNKLKALDILNKMDGEYITKIDASVDLSDIRVEIEND